MDAISKSTDERRALFQPLIEVPPLPLKYLVGVEEPVLAKEIDAHAAAVAKSLAASIGIEHPVFVDGFYIEDETMKDGTDPSGAVFAGLRAKGVKFVPATGLDRVDDYARSVRDAIAADRRGCLLRLVESDLESIADLGAQISGLLDFLGVRPGDVDLLIDFGPKVPPRATLPLLVNALPMVGDWRSLTFASSAFPKDMSDVTRNSLEEVERSEWLSWTFLRSRAADLRRLPDFGDYAINHPELAEIDPRVMRISPNIRYTSELTYVLAKGAAYPRKKDKAKVKLPELEASEQYPRVAGMIMDHPSWRGPEFSWGDAFIAACARRECVGNTTNWRAVGTVHHIASVVTQLASLP